MDPQKDIRTTQSLSAFFEKQPSITSLSLNPSVERLYRRSERVVAALFLATNHIEPNEPLRVSVRSAGTKLLENVLALRNELRAAQSPNVSEFRASARYLVSLLRMLTISGFLSVQNGSILIEAIDELGNFLQASQTSPLSESVVFSKQDFLDASVTRVMDIKDRVIVKDGTVIKDTHKMSDSVIKRTLHVRKQNIIEVLRGGGELGIAEIASSLPEYSSKMIQRDLAELIVAGQVKRAGLKRWSRYSLAQ
jgi:hypothetical protein